MGLTKRDYVDGVTVITAQNLNDIQDEIIANGTAIATQATQISSKADASALAAETAAREAADTTLGNEVDDVKSALTSVSTRADILHDTINYQYDSIQELVAQPASGVYRNKLGIKREYSQVKLNVQSPVNYLLVAKISGDIERAATYGQTDAFTGGILLSPGHTYRVDSIFISGEVAPPSGTKPPSCGVYKVGSHISINSTGYDGLNSYGIFVAPQEPVNLAMRIQINTVLTDATWQVLLRDMTALTEKEALENEAKSLGLHTVPESVGVLNAIKRARQMTDMVWSPAGTIPRAFVTNGESMAGPHKKYRGTFAEGKEYKGLPYTLQTLIGQDVSFDTFATSVANPESAEIVDSVFTSYDRPSLYGTVCTGLSSYAIDIPNVHSTYWLNINGISSVGDVNSLAFADYKLGDILQINGHCCIVTDIDPENLRFEISEATRVGNPRRSITDGDKGSLCRRFTVTHSGLKSSYAGYTVLRYAFIDNVPYYPTAFSPLPGEGTPLAFRQMPILPYEGNKASYSTYQSGPTVKLLIADTGFTHVVVLKDGQPYNEDGTTNPYPINGADFINVVCERAEAIYNAYLVEMSDDTVVASSVWCEWACRPYPTITVNIIDGTVKFSFTVKTGVYKPYYVSFGSASTVLGNFIRVFPGDYTSTVNNDGTTTYSFELAYPDDNPTSGHFGFKSETFGMAQMDWRL